MRVTRAAVRAGAEHHNEEDVDHAPDSQTNAQDRAPLDEVTANTAPEIEPTDAHTKKAVTKKAKPKGGAKKGAKGKKAKPAEEEADPGIDLPEDQQALFEAAVDNLPDVPPTDDVQTTATDDDAAIPAMPEVRMTRRQQAKQDNSRRLRSRGPPATADTDLEPTSARATETPIAGPQQDPEVLEASAVVQAQPEEAQPEEAQPEEAQPEEAQPEEEQPEEAQLEEPTPEEPTSKETQSEEVALENTNTEEVRPKEDQLEKPQPEDLQAEEAQTEEGQAQIDVQLQRANVERQENIQEAHQFENTVKQHQEEPLPELISAVKTLQPTAMTLETPQDNANTPVEIVQPEPKTRTPDISRKEESLLAAASATPTRASSRNTSKSPNRTPLRLEDSIGAIDALEEALEDVGQSLPTFDQLEKANDSSPRKAKTTRTAAPRKSIGNSSLTSTASKRLSLTAKTAKPTGLSRSSSVRAPPKDRKASGEAADYLASKRRPISMNFAAPPPPAKSTKAPTRPTFQLPGEAIAAKLKAQKEERLERMKQEGGVAKQRPANMPPPAKSTKPPTRPNFQLPGEKLAAKLKAQKEERQKQGESGPSIPRTVNLPPPPKSTKPPTRPNFQLPGEAVAAKLKAQREERLKREEAKAVEKATFKARPAPARNTVVAPVRATAASQARERLMEKDNSGKSNVPPLGRSSSLSVNKRNSVAQPCKVSASSSTSNATTGNKNKGREVFNRDRQEKDSKDQERKDKEEAAKKARAEAAERGRIASREWAEKQRKKMMASSMANASSA